MCFVLIPSGPVERDEHASGTKQFTKQLLLQCFNEPLWCLGSCICCPCANYRLREDVLDKNWSKYECCQGKLNSCMCINSEWCQNSAQQCPQACAAMESCCCACAMIGNRDYLIDIQHYESDPCDRRMIWCSNTCCWICRESITEEANCVNYLKMCWFCFFPAFGCAAAQVHGEVEKLHELGVSVSGSAVPSAAAGPVPATMTLDATH